jgi:hypothetical protein
MTILWHLGVFGAVRGEKKTIALLSKSYKESCWVFRITPQARPRETFHCRDIEESSPDMAKRSEDRFESDSP